jgi:peptidoglycan hydrolase CwlO-like protein
MSEYISARDALIRDLESAEAALGGANKSYADVQRDLQRVQTRADHAYEGRKKNQRNVDRLKKALAILEGEDE